jgi:tryptophan-rich sensory protein
MNSNEIFNIVAPPILTLIFSGICYAWARTTRRGKPLTSLQRGMILYAAVFALGMVYLILFQDGLGRFFRWRDAWIAALVLWGVMLAALAWRRHRSTIAR